MNHKYNTLDIDNSDKILLDRIVLKVSQCKNLLKMRVKPSNLKGYHIKLVCSAECEICRMVFDDTLRYYFDGFRKVESQNVLFDEKKLEVVNK